LLVVSILTVYSRWVVNVLAVYNRQVVNVLAIYSHCEYNRQTL